MKQFLRTVKSTRWYKHPQVSWLGEGELQGDALKDVMTCHGRLSVFMISNESDERRVITALAATKDHIANVDYITFEASKLNSIEITIKQTDGYTADAIANKLHHDLEYLSVKRLVKLVEVISDCPPRRKQRKEVKECLRAAMRAGILDTTKINSNEIKNL